MNWFKKLFRKKPKRIDLRFVTYAEGEKLVKQGWQLAIPEEDGNLVKGMVWLELLEKPHEHGQMQ